jgi:hypothetical protein
MAESSQPIAENLVKPPKPELSLHLLQNEGNIKFETMSGLPHQKCHTRYRE